MAKLTFQNEELSSTSTQILDKTKEKLGFVPNMYKKFAHNTSLLDAYVHSYNSFRSNAGFNSVEQEVILLTVAYTNNCEYCMAAHSFVAENKSNVPIEVIEAIRSGRTIPDTKLNILSETTKVMTENRGHLKADELENFLSAGYEESHVLGIITGIAVKVMSNYSNHNTHPELDEYFLSHLWTKK